MGPIGSFMIPGGLLGLCSGFWLGTECPNVISSCILQGALVTICGGCDWKATKRFDFDQELNFPNTKNTLWTHPPNFWDINTFWGQEFGGPKRFGDINKKFWGQELCKFRLTSGICFDRGDSGPQGTTACFSPPNKLFQLILHQSDKIFPIHCKIKVRKSKCLN